jgi:hypothetical protein
MNVIDRLFIATNVELINMVDNADRALCRFEFFEIIVRIALHKLLEPGYFSNLHLAVEALLENFIFRFRVEKMEGQAWRERELWTIEVDAFFKANLRALNKVSENTWCYLCSCSPRSVLTHIRSSSCLTMPS